MSSEKINIEPRRWNVLLNAYVPVTHIVSVEFASDVDDASYQGLAADYLGWWSVLGEDAMSANVTEGAFVTERYVTHCSPHQKQKWACGIAGNLLLGRNIEIEAYTAHEARELAKISAVEGTWFIGAEVTKSSARFDVANADILMNISAPAVALYLEKNPK